jgi:hypothetical protein
MHVYVLEREREREREREKDICIYHPLLVQKAVPVNVGQSSLFSSSIFPPNSPGECV